MKNINCRSELALFARIDGLAMYRGFIPQALAGLVSGGWLVLEIGCGEQAAARGLAEDSGFAEIAVTADLKGIPRVASA